MSLVSAISRLSGPRWPGVCVIQFCILEVEMEEGKVFKYYLLGYTISKETKQH